jgi:hypothetical protein
LLRILLVLSGAIGMQLTVFGASDAIGLVWSQKFRLLAFMDSADTCLPRWLFSRESGAMLQGSDQSSSLLLVFK